MALSNDAYADYALNIYGKYKAWSGSVSNGGSPKFARAYSYDELVQLGRGALSSGAGGQMDSEENIRKYITGLQADYDKQVQSVFTSGSRAGQESTVARYIDGSYSYSTPSQDTANKLSALNNLINPGYQSPLVKNHLKNLATQDFDPHRGFIDKPSSQESNGGTLEINTNNETPEGDTVYGFNNLLQGFDQRAANFAQRNQDFTNSMIMFPNSRKFSPTQHYFIDKLKITNRN